MCIVLDVVMHTRMHTHTHSCIHHPHTPTHRFDFITVPLFHPRYKREYFLENYSRPGPATRSDKVVTSSDWSTLVVAKLSPWIQLDSKDETVRRLSEKVTSKFFLLLLLIFFCWLCRNHQNCPTLCYTLVLYY